MVVGPQPRKDAAGIWEMWSNVAQWEWGVREREVEVREYEWTAMGAVS